MGLLYGRAGRLTAENGGFRRGQWRHMLALREGDPAIKAYLDGAVGPGVAKASL
jgi:hypothetical protein